MALRFCCATTFATMATRTMESLWGADTMRASLECKTEHNHGDVTRALSHLKSSVTRLFAQQFTRAYEKENIKFYITVPLSWVSTGNWVCKWVPFFHKERFPLPVSISFLKNDRKWKYVFMYLKIKLKLQGSNIRGICLSVLVIFSVGNYRYHHVYISF